MGNEIDTPFVLIDTAVMRKNIEKMAIVASANGVNLRPHIKTHKIPEIAHLQVKAGAVGITVAKLAEAEVMADAGIEDIFVAYPIVGETKANRAAELCRKVPKFCVGVDSLIGAHSLSVAAVKHGIQFNVRLEIDTGLRRTGVPYNEAVERAQQVARMDGLKLTGIFTYRGAILGTKPTTDRQAAGYEEGQLMVKLADRMREAGLTIEDVSVGSTPTGSLAAAVPGVTEIRPGTYVFQDRMQVKFGGCALGDCAAAVHVTVVSRPMPDLIVIDGGSKTFATDVGPGVEPLMLKGFGYVLEYPHVVFERMNEEHGMIRVSPDDPIAIGDQLRIVPNHICSTINLHNEVYFKEQTGIRAVKVGARGKLN